jgi:hypothetical protein
MIVIKVPIARVDVDSLYNPAKVDCSVPVKSNAAHCPYDWITNCMVFSAGGTKNSAWCHACKQKRNIVAQCPMQPQHKFCSSCMQGHSRLDAPRGGWIFLWF